MNAIDKLNEQGRKVFDLREAAKTLMRTAEAANYHDEALMKASDLAYDVWDAAADEIADRIREMAAEMNTRPEELLMRRMEPKVAEILAAQQSQFDARRASLEGELQILDKQIASKRSEINGLIGQQRSKESQLESFRAELAGLGDLMARGMVERLPDPRDRRRWPDIQRHAHRFRAG